MCRLGLILWLLALVTTDDAVEIRLLTPSPHADDLLTWEIDGVDPVWLTVASTATPVLEMSDQTGRTWRRKAFAYRDFALQADRYEALGESRLQVRDTPRVAGELHWRLVDTAGTELKSGTVTVAPARGALGPIGISATNHRLLAFPDGTPFIPIGLNLAWAGGPDHLEQFRTWFTALSQAGGNHVRLWLASWCGQIIGDKPDEWRLDQAWLLDRILALAREQGIRVTVVLDNHHDFTTGKGVPYGKDRAARLMAFADGRIPELYEHRLRYLLARWGADDTVLAWEVFNEIDLAGNDDQFAAFWAGSLTEHLAAWDQDRRLHTVSWSGTRWRTAMTKPAVDLAQVHLYVQPAAKRDQIGAPIWHDMLTRMAESAAETHGLDKPFLFAEVGYQGENSNNPGNERDREGFLFFQQVWAGLMLGGCGSGMNWWWDVYVQPNQLWHHYAGLAKVVKLVDWRDANLAPFQVTGGSLHLFGWRSPRQALVWPVLESDTWFRNVVAQKARPALSHDMVIRLEGMLPNRPFWIHHLDMRDGSEPARRAGASDGSGVIQVTIPAQSIDRVLWVEVR